MSQQQFTGKSKMTANDDPDILVIEVCDRQDSSFVLDGSEKEGTPVYLDCPARLRIVPKCVVFMEDKNVELRYIKTANTIFKEEQDEKGLVFNGQRDQIVIENGRLTVQDTGATKSLYAYLKMCPFNEDSPYRRSDVEPRFREIKQSEENKNLLNFEKLALRAKGAIGNLYKYDPKTEEMVYDKARLEFQAKMFNLVGLTDPDEILKGLFAIAGKFPELYLKTISESSSEYIVAIRTAKDLGIIIVDGPQVLLAETKAPIFDFTKKKWPEREAEFANYLQSNDGTMVYDSLTTAIEAGKEDVS